jgi:GNAT superfamily N-acetyltransferase
MVSTSGLVRLTRENIKPAADLMVRAFQDYPLSPYFVPNEVGRQRKQAVIFRGMIRYGLIFGEVYAISPRLEGVAVWLLSGTRRETLWDNIRSGWIFIPMMVGIRTMTRQRNYDEYTTSVRRRCAPARHWYLLLLGVDPACQGRGYASRLLKPMFERADKDGLACFLETEAEKNVALYEHLGFRVVEEGIVPGSNVKSWAMLGGGWRPSRWDYSPFTGKMAGANKGDKQRMIQGGLGGNKL